jgi:DedD protein
MPLPPPPPQSRFSLSRLFGAAPAAAARGGAPDAALGSDATVEALRTQARRRLIGVVVLLAIGVVSFPLVFETEPRPMGVDTPMQRLPGGSASAGRVTEAAPASLATAPPSASARPAAEGAAPVVQPESATENAPATMAATPPAPSTAVSPAATVPAPAAVESPAPTRPVPTSAAAKADAKAEVRPEAPVEPPGGGQSEAQRARALLEGRSPAAAERARPAEPVVAARFVVQVGAYTEPRTLREVRGRVEALGLKTYTQVVDSPAGPRTRVRVGPFDSRAEAEAASAKLRGVGLPGAILAL